MTRAQSAQRRAASISPADAIADVYHRLPGAGHEGSSSCSPSKLACPPPREALARPAGSLGSRARRRLNHGLDQTTHRNERTPRERPPKRYGPNSVVGSGDAAKPMGDGCGAYRPSPEPLRRLGHEPHGPRLQPDIHPLGIPVPAEPRDGGRTARLPHAASCVGRSSQRPSHRMRRGS